MKKYIKFKSYSPIITAKIKVYYYNNHSPIQYTDDEVKLHVPSASEIQTKALNQINGLIAFILLIFGFMGAIKLVTDLTKEREK